VRLVGKKVFAIAKNPQDVIEVRGSRRHFNFLDCCCCCFGIDLLRLLFLTLVTVCSNPSDDDDDDDDDVFLLLQRFVIKRLLLNLFAPECLHTFLPAESHALLLDHNVSALLVGLEGNEYSEMLHSTFERYSSACRNPAHKLFNGTRRDSRPALHMTVHEFIQWAADCGATQVFDREGLACMYQALCRHLRYALFRLD
jgi:hypothetical protein